PYAAGRPHRLDARWQGRTGRNSPSRQPRSQLSDAAGARRGRAGWRVLHGSLQRRGRGVGLLRRAAAGRKRAVMLYDTYAQCITLVVGNPEGGVGKSTVANTLAAGFAMRGYRVLL